MALNLKAIILLADPGWASVPTRAADHNREIKLGIVWLKTLYSVAPAEMHLVDGLNQLKAGLGGPI